MREDEKQVGHPDGKQRGERSTAEGETQPPDKVRENVKDDNGPHHGGSADWGGEGGGGASYYGGKTERKDRS